MSQYSMAGPSQPVPAAKVAAPPYAWVILVTVFMAGVAAPLNQFKVPPLMPVLMESFRLELSTAGLLMSIFAVTGFILALPAGFILQRFGPKITGLMAVGCIALGAGIGALASTAGLLLISRGIEGIGMGLIAIVAPAVIAAWFPAEARGVPMGIWATWVPLGGVIMYNVAPPLGVTLGWQAVWWVGAAFALLTFGLYWLFIRRPPEQRQPDDAPPTPASPPSGLSAVKANRSMWLLSLQFCCFNVTFGAIGAFMPTFLAAERGYTLSAAALITSLSMLATIVSCPLSGWISDYLGSRKLTYTIPAIIIAVMWLFPFHISGWMLPAFMIVLGSLAGAVPTATFAAVPEVMGQPEKAGIGLAILALGQNLGMFMGPLVFGWLVESTTWATAGYLLIPISIAGVVAGWLVKVR
ncbi:MAG: MFS transporter [Anaerolineae bacterium]